MDDVDASANASDTDGWPADVSSADYIAMTLVPVGTLLLIAATLRRDHLASLCWPRSTQPRDPDRQLGPERIEMSAATAGKAAMAADNDYLYEDSWGDDQLLTVPDAQDDDDDDADSGILLPATAEPRPGDSDPEAVLQPGQTAGDYDEDWTGSFDAVFLAFMAAGLAALIIATSSSRPELWTKPMLWTAIAAKFGAMTVVSVLGGLLCRQFCAVDGQGYIATTESSWFKVNYTRKLQHFAAYMVPLVIHPPEACGCSGLISDLWSNWITLFAFMILIKPIRERLLLAMLQFNSLDRPEDRPHTLKWIVLGNILPGLCLIILYRNVFAALGHSPDLVFVFIYITGIGDGLAEPVGIWFGKHKYRTRSCMSSRKYTRSWEGSACVFLSGLVFPLVQYQDFGSRQQMWVAAAILAPGMAIAEATSPHTMDTPFLMGFGGLVLLGVVHFT